jgi:uncharacterized lipoprotein
MLGVLVNYLAACGVFADRSVDYLDAEHHGLITIPDGLTQQKINARYRIPEIENEKVLTTSYSLPQPPDATAALREEPYFLQTMDDTIWLEIAMAPSKAWPLLDLFWTNYSLDLVAEDVESGYFASKKIETIDRHKQLSNDLEMTDFQPIVIDGMSFQARLSQGVRRKSAELRVRALTPDFSVSSSEVWQDDSVYPRLEKAMLELMGDFITSEATSSRYSLNAINLGDDSLVKQLEDEAGYVYLQLELPFDRAWNEVGDALKSSGVVIADRNRSEGVYYVSYLNKDDIESWYSFESSVEEKRQEQNVELRFFKDDERFIRVRAKILNPDVEPEVQDQLIETVFEHIS